VKKSRELVRRLDLAVLVLAHGIFGEEEIKLLKLFEKWELPHLLVYNKSDLGMPSEKLQKVVAEHSSAPLLPFSTKDPAARDGLIKEMAQAIPETAYQSRSLVGDIISQGQLVLLITPIDEEAPEGRLILPQVQAIRDILDNDAIAIVAKEREVDALMKQLNPEPALVICDSQVFKKADASIPDHIPLTSFSTVLARHKGDFESYLKGTPKLAQLEDGDRILILESCTHQVSCDDIGRVKIPRWLSAFSGKQLEFEVVAGLNAVPGDIRDYAMVIQCGGCMITRKQLINRLKPALDAGIPVTNYGMAIAYLHGIYERAIAPFTELEEGSSYL
jgi:[FeFe] hydrogenase H-cluster maturation GTPase HydF